MTLMELQSEHLQIIENGLVSEIAGFNAKLRSWAQENPDTRNNIVTRLLLTECQCGSIGAQHWTRRIRVEGEELTICGDCEGNFFFWDSDGQFHREPDPATLVRVYHGTSRKKLYDGINWNDDSLLGIEIETEVRDYHCVKEVHASDLPVIMERDGSLGPRGVEFIFRPIAYQALMRENYVLKVLEILRKHKVQAWDAGENYGCHISVNAIPMTMLHRAKFAAFINMNSTLGVQIAGRPSTRFANYHKCRIPDYNRDNGKYLACAIRPNNRLEVRIFKSSIQDARIQAYAQYVRSAWEFSKTASNQRLTAKNYLEWLKEPVQQKVYSLLVLLRKHCSEDFFVKEEHAHSQS